MNLSYEDYNFLLEALDAKATEAMSSGMLEGMMGVMMSKNKEEALATYKSEMEKARKIDKLISERIILLKAKLITLRDKEMIANIDTKGARK